MYMHREVLIVRAKVVDSLQDKYSLRCEVVHTETGDDSYKQAQSRKQAGGNTTHQSLNSTPSKRFAKR